MLTASPNVVQKPLSLYKKKRTTVPRVKAQKKKARRHPSFLEALLRGLRGSDTFQMGENLLGLL